MSNKITSIALDKLVRHPDNPNVMSKSNFAKLVRNIERTGMYEPLIVRPIDSRFTKHDSLKKVRRTFFQIINGHHRYKALSQLGCQRCDCIIWDIDDEQADIFLATLNRLCGNDMLDKKLKLLKRMSEKFKAGELAKLLPQTSKQIERLTNLKPPEMSAAAQTRGFAEPLVFFLNETQKTTVENAMLLAQKADNKKPKAQRNSEALTKIAESFIDRRPKTQDRKENQG
jgi:ParB-like chromosome segregation protein Spo0J